MVPLKRILIFVALSIVVACSPRGEITLYPEAALVGQVRNIYIGTTRKIAANGRMTHKREANVTFHRYDISVPPLRETGEISWPRRKIDPHKAFYTTGIDHFTGAGGFITDLSKALRKQPKRNREVIVFVHGFNSNFAEGLYRFAQLSHDIDLSNPIVHYSWPSLAKPLGYEYDRDSALFARDGLEELLHTVKAAGADKILLVGHSMGTLIAVETLRQMSISNSRGLQNMLAGVVLISPDIDVDLFRQQAAKIQPMPQPFVIFTSQKDRALRLSALLTGKRERLGNVNDIGVLGDLRVTVIDVTKFSNSLDGHFTQATSPTLLKLLKQMNRVNTAFQNDRTVKAGVLPGTILTIRKATKIILSPAHELSP